MRARKAYDPAMISLRSLLFSLVGLFAALPLAQAGDAPAPVPPGFVREKLDEIKTTLIKPKDWHVVHHLRKDPADPIAFQVTQEDVEKLGSFKTGLTINVYDQVPARFRVQPSEFAAELLKLYAAKGTVETEKKDIPMGKLMMSRMQMKRTMSLLGKETETRLVVTTMANNTTGTCFLFIFGTPMADWEATLPILTQMSLVVIDDDR